MTSSSNAAPNVSAILDRFRALESPENKAGMARYGIKSDNAYGVSLYVIRDIAKELGKNHELALALWATGNHEAQLLASIVDDPKQATAEQLDQWVSEFDSWDICDQCCSNLFAWTPFAYEKAFEWADDEREFVRRAGFVMMAALAVHDKKAGDEKFEQFFPVMKKYASDDRNFVRKAVNWALRNIGKRNLTLNARATEVAREIKALDTKAARWIASDALRELEGEKVQARLVAKEQKRKK